MSQRAGAFYVTCELLEELFNKQLRVIALLEHEGKMLAVAEGHPALPEIPFDLESAVNPATPVVTCVMKKDAAGKRTVKFEKTGAKYD